MVWTINTPDLAPPDDGVTKIDYGTPAPVTTANLAAAKYSFGTAKCLDESEQSKQQHKMQQIVCCIWPASCMDFLWFAPVYFQLTQLDRDFQPRFLIQYR